MVVRISSSHFQVLPTSAPIMICNYPVLSYCLPLSLVFYFPNACQNEFERAYLDVCGLPFDTYSSSKQKIWRYFLQQSEIAPNSNTLYKHECGDNCLSPHVFWHASIVHFVCDTILCWNNFRFKIRIITITVFLQRYVLHSWLSLVAFWLTFLSSRILQPIIFNCWSVQTKALLLPY